MQRKPWNRNTALFERASLLVLVSRGFDGSNGIVRESERATRPSGGNRCLIVDPEYRRNRVFVVKRSHAIGNLFTVVEIECQEPHGLHG